MATTRPPQSAGSAPSEVSSALELIAELEQTAASLRNLAAELAAMDLPVVLTDELMASIWPDLPEASAIDRVVLHVLMLEDAGRVVTWVSSSGRECLAFTGPSGSPEPPGGAPNAATRTGPFSTAGQREGGKEKEREQERARARERVQERERVRKEELAGRWADWEREQEGLGQSRPERPAILDAPPIGCPEHPNGSRYACGPCGTQRKRHDKWLAEQRYLAKLTLFEQFGDTGEGWDGEPF